MNQDSAVDTELLITPRTISQHWTCIVCGGSHYPQMVQMVMLFALQRWVGKACLSHSREEIRTAARIKEGLA